MKAILAFGLAAGLLIPSQGMAAPAATAGQTAEQGSPAGRRAELRERLFAALAAAPTEAQGRAVEDEIWRFWLDLAPDPDTRRLVDQAMDRRESYDFAGAEALLDEAVARAPDYAEAFNQRAFVRFLRENDEGAEADLLRALELEPRHFGALSGLFHVLMRGGRAEQATAALVRAVKIHPWLKERHMLPPDPNVGRPPIVDREQDL